MDPQYFVIGPNCWAADRDMRAAMRKAVATYGTEPEGGFVILRAVDIGRHFASVILPIITIGPEALDMPEIQAELASACDIVILLRAERDIVYHYDPTAEVQAFRQAYMA